MPIASRVLVNVIDMAPAMAIPDLHTPIVYNTSGAPKAKDRVLTGTTIDSFAGYLDVTDPGYIMLQRIFSQTPRASTVYLWTINRYDYKVATGTSGSEDDNNALLYTAQTRGPLGDNVEVELKDPNSADSTLDVDTEIKLETGVVADDNALIWTSKKGYKDLIKVEFVDPGVASAEASVSVTSAELTTYDNGSYEHVISISLATDAMGNITTTANDVISLISNDPTASELVTVQNAAGSDGSGTVAAMTEKPIPFRVVVWLGTNSDGTIISTATEVKNAINTDTTSDAPQLVNASNYGTSDGSGVVAPATVDLSRNNTPDSPSELTRGLENMWRYIKIHELPYPYFLVCTSADEVEGDRAELSDAVAGLTTTIRRMFYVTRNRNDETPEEIHQLADTMASDRTLIFAHTDADNEYPDADLVGNWSGHLNGQYTTMWKHLNTLPAAQYDESAEALIEGQAPGGPGAFSYIKIFGSPVTTGSWATDGSFADWRWDKDWLELHMTARIVYLLRSQPKVLGDARGIAQLKSVTRQVMNQAADMGIVAVDDTGRPLYFLDFPDIYEWDVLDKAVRHYRIAKVVFHPGNGIEQVTMYLYATLDAHYFRPGEQVLPITG